MDDAKRKAGWQSERRHLNMRHGHGEAEKNARPLETEDQIVEVDVGKMVSDISTAERRVLSFAKALKNMGVPSSLPNTN